MRARSRSLVSSLILGGGVTVTGFFVFAPSSALAETSYHKLKKHLRTAEHNSGVVLGQIFADGEPDGNLEIDLYCGEIEGVRREQSHQKVNPPKSANPPAPTHKEPAKPAHPEK